MTTSRTAQARTVQERPTQRLRVQAYTQRIEKVIHYIEDHLDGDLSLQQLSRVAAFSPFQFHRKFVSASGMSAAELVRQLRLRRASLLLAFNPHQSVTTIALDCGFTNPQSFSRTFKQHFGQTPSAFKQQPIANRRARDNARRCPLEPACQGKFQSELHGVTSLLRGRGLPRRLPDQVLLKPSRVWLNNRANTHRHRGE